MQFVNQFSFLIFAAIALLVLGWIILRSQHASTRWFALGALVLGLILSFWIFNPGPGDTFDLAGIQPGTDRSVPLLIEFESPYCLGCMAAQPTVDQVRQEYGSQIDIVQINVLDRAAGPLLAAYGFRYTPTFIFIDASGTEVWRAVGALDPEQVAASLESGP
ncbi:MAG: thioredoxin family protein [Anaerolineales bacterium]|jgi:thiol-disulfide isomerase/thioredoxin